MNFPLFQFKKQQLTALTRAVTQLSSCLDVADVSRTVTQQLLKLLRGDACMLAGWNTHLNRLEQWDVAVARHLEDRGAIQHSLSISECSPIYAIVKEGKSVQFHVDEPDTAPDVLAYLRQQHVQSILLVPVQSKGILYGLVCVLHLKQIRKFTEEDVALAYLLASQASVAIENARLYQSLKKHTTEMEALHQVSLGLTGSLQLEAILNVILRSTLKFLNDAQDAHIFLYQDDQLEFGAAIWADGRAGVPVSEPRPHGLTYTVAREGKMIVVPNSREHSLYQDCPIDWHGSIAGLPLKIGWEVVGVISIAWAHPRVFSESELRFLKLLGDQAALAIEKARLYQLISLQAHTDSLTRLPNRRSFDQHLDEEIRRASRYHHPLSLLMLDLDGFKHINDHYGHPAGDEILEKVGRLLQSSTRDTDFSARIGGDEFALIFPETNAETARKILLNLKNQFAGEVFRLKTGTELHLTAAMGTATFPEDGENRDKLLSTADRSMYADKALFPRLD